MSGNGRNIFRLAMLLCLAFVIEQNFGKNQQEKPPAQYGIGGGNFTGTVISAADIGLAGADLESVAIEPESFSKTRMLLYDTHVMQKNENISRLAVKFGLNDDTIISANKVKNTRLVQIGQILKIPNQDGVFHTVNKGETITSIAEKYKSDPKAIQIVNELFTDNIKQGTDIFVPGARLDWVYKQEINGDLFIWPVSGLITSPYGYRRNPFGSNQQFHSGIDIRAATGTPIRAAMSGRVSNTGYDHIFGNYVVISHHSGYRTLYGHMSVIRVKTGAYVGTGERIGDAGSTGLSTGSHLHFTVYKNGVTVNPRSLMR
ncbi:MAG: M23 family metallopeptidase [Treponema sp.]|jgi:murein DD-endopeptidase MepM/ murein hydrolase activator NlpD|nr:M23 family metallopeptidase [Treponema sp.]